MKKVVFSLILTGLLFGNDSTIGGLLKEIKDKAVSKNYSAVKKNIYGLNRDFNYNWIIGGMKHKNPAESDDNGFSLEALNTLIKHSNSFKPLSKSPLYGAVKKGFLKSFKDNDPKAPFSKDLKNGAKNIYILDAPKTKSMVLVFNNGGHYKLVWWKEMIRVANQIDLLRYRDTP